jgi:hypothetical protein
MAGWTGHTPRSVGIGEALPQRQSSGPEVVEPRGSLPHRPVHQDLRAIIIRGADCADYEPTRWYGVRCWKGRRQGVVFAAGEYEIVRICASGGGDCLERFRQLKSIPT